jgi:inorganic pyrophosphatase
MEDESGLDAKVLAVPKDKLTRRYRGMETFRDLPHDILERIAHFFEHYKDLEQGKWVKVKSWGGVEDAKKEILDSIERYKNAPDKPAF